MSFQDPLRLLVLALPLVLLGLLLAQRSRSRRYVVRFSSLELVEGVMPRRPGWRRWATTGAAILGLAALGIAFARPVVAVPVPRDQAAIVLAVDVSLSMGAADVPPSRLEAAQEAALRFLRLAPEELGVGLVAFAGTALPVVGPDGEREVVESAVSRLALAEGTAVGEAVHAALELLRQRAAAPDAPAAIVLLSDGETTVGRSPLEAAQAAAQAGVPVFTISFGTAEGFIVFQGQAIPVPPDPRSLAEVAEISGGRSFQAATEEELQEVLSSVGSQIAYELEEREVTDWFAGAGLAAIGLAAFGSLVWFGRLL